MTTYKEIFGKQIKQLSTDPTDAGAEGQVWYNTTSGTFKTVTAVGAWSSGGALPQVVSYNSGAGTQTAALSIGGQEASTSAIQNTYEYDGSSWSDGGPVAPIYPGVSSYYGASCGTQTAALIVGGGSGTNATGEYNGSSWTATGNYPVTTFMGTANGIQTAAINIGGRVPPGSVATGIVANYNGSTWTASPVAISPAQYKNSSAGTSTATIVSGGITPSATVTTAQEWDGSSWTTVGAPSAPKSAAKSTGIQTLALKMYGTTGGTEQYNGSSWTTVANQAIARDWATGGGSNDSNGATGVMFGGKTSSGSPSFQSATEEFNYSIYSPIAATWASGGNMGTARYGINYGIGTQTAALVAGGYPGPMSTAEIYDGSSWTAITNLPYVIHDAMGIGTQTAAYVVGGAPTTNNVRKWDGSSWSTTPSISSGREDAASSGSASDGFIAGGSSVATEEWNGSSWTGGGNLPVSLNHNQGAGTASAGLSFGGRAPGYLTTTNEYDGSSWTGGGNLNVGRSLFVGGGTQTLAFAACAQPPPGPSAITELYNGTAWSVAPNLATGRYTGGGTGATSSAAMVNGGQVGDNVGMTTTEEFTGEIQALDYKTLTSS
jgi:hypothetical protein